MEVTAYAAAISKTLPNSFVPDIAGAPAPHAELLPDLPAEATTDASFKDTLKGYLSDVSDKINEADKQSMDLATGRTNDSGKVATTVEEAQLAMQYLLAIRTNLLNAYTDIKAIQM